jgi:MFS family permease
MPLPHGATPHYSALMSPAPVGARLWTWAVLLGLTGQLAWAIENMYLNVFVYDTITDSPTVLAVLVASSAIAATVATLLAGAASDRRGRRKEFIAIGYVLWGLSTLGFGFLDDAPRLLPGVNAVTVAIVAVILLDCLMSALGATANDAAFNSWITDSTDPTNRGRVDGVLAMLPLLAMLLVFGALDPLTRDGQWRLFFAIVGGLTTLVGLIAWMGLRDTATPRPSGTYVSSVLHGLRPSTARQHPRLYLTLAAWAVLGISTQVFLPFLIIYVQRYLDIEAYAVVLAAVLLGAALASVLGGRVLDRVGPTRALLPVVALYVTGLLAMYFARGMVPVILAGIVTMSGMMLAIAALSATVRNHTPADRVGQVQGLRMVAAVLLPMVVGPFLGAAVIAGANETYVDLGVTKTVPTPWVFPTSAVVVLLIIWPVTRLRRVETPA